VREAKPKILEQFHHVVKTAKGGRSNKLTNRLDDIVRRQASILSEIDRLDRAELEFLANSPLAENTIPSEDDKARRLIRGLVRSENLARGRQAIESSSNKKAGIILAQPDFFVIYLMPLPDGGFDRERVMKTPVLAWRVDGSNCAAPVIPGIPVIDRWAVLTPCGTVMTDEFTNLLGDPPLALKDWIKSEIEWVESQPDVPELVFPTVCTTLH
jgi:hypothetical protein